MLTMEQIYSIRKKYFDEGLSLRQIAALTGYDRSTVTRYVKMEDFSPEIPLRIRRGGKTDPYRHKVREWLEADQDAPRDQRHTAKRVYDLLKEESEKAKKPFDVSERAIRSLVAELRAELSQAALVSLPLLHPAGESQTDFGRTVFHEKQVRYEGHHFGLTFPHSDAKYVQLFKGENFECLAQGLCDIFEFIGGVPRKIWFDNMSTAVKKILSDGQREVTDNFHRLQCHFGFESNFCNPASGHEKGSVENYIGYSRRNYFVPVPRIDDLQAYNQDLLVRCHAHLDREHYKVDRLVSELFEADRSQLRPLPAYPFDACRYVPVRTNNYGKFRFQGNTYSSADTFRSCQLTLKVGAHQVTVLDDRMKQVVVHPRLYGKGKESMLWGPYLDVLAQRPTALRYSGFFEDLPPSLRQFLDSCEMEGKRQVLRLLAKANQTCDLEQSIDRLADAVMMGVHDVDSLIAAYHFISNKPEPILKNPVPEHIQVAPDYELDLSVYKQLMGGVACQKR